MPQRGLLEDEDYSNGDAESQNRNHLEVVDVAEDGGDHQDHDLVVLAAAVNTCMGLADTCMGEAGEGIVPGTVREEEGASESKDDGSYVEEGVHIRGNGEVESFPVCACCDYDDFVFGTYCQQT